MLTREHHPCQALADLVTLRERFGHLEGLRLAYVGDGNNMARSLLLLGGAGGGGRGGGLSTGVGPSRGGADVTGRGGAGRARALHRRVAEHGRRPQRREARLLDPYRLDEALLSQARDDAIALHCLPAHPGEEISEGLLYGERSAVWDQAENRLHAQKALLELLMST